LSSTRSFGNRTTIVFLGLFLSLCWIEFASARVRDPISTNEVDRRMRELDHQPWDPSTGIVETVDRVTSACVTSEITLKRSDKKTGTVEDLTFTLVKPNGTGAVPSILLNPSISGVTILERSLAKKYCTAGVAVLITNFLSSELPENLPAWGEEDKQYILAIHRLKTAIDFVQSDSRFLPDKIGLVGLSLGGITSAILASVEPRLQSVVIMVGGGNLPSILTESQARHVRSMRAERMQAAGLTSLSEYEEMLHKTIKLDPIYTAGRIGSERVLMVLAENDRSVPSAYQRNLRDVIGNPEQMVYSGSHVWTLIEVVFWAYDQVITFTKAKWGMTLDEGAYVPKPWEFQGELATQKHSPLMRGYKMSTIHERFGDILDRHPMSDGI
jgi:dienelactone hydrolase